MLYLFLLVSLFHSTWTILLQDDSLSPLYNSDDNPSYLYLDTRSVKGSNGEAKEADIEARRRSTMARNFIRLGRRDMQQPIRNNYDLEYDDYVDDFQRPSRTDKSDHFIRFGRGKGDFIRFGRDSTITRSPSSYFRLGRSTDWQSKRNKRDTFSQSQDQDAKRNSNFIRFGRTHNFLRFGRNQPDDAEGTSERESAFSKFKQQEANLLQILKELACKLRDQQSESSPKSEQTAQ